MSSVQKKFRVDGLPILAEAPGKWNGKLAVILAHGAGSGMDSDFMRAFSAATVGSGAAAVRFNFPYMEAGRRAPDSQKKLEAGYLAVIHGVAEKLAPKRLLIGGKSMGGRIASSIAGRVLDDAAVPLAGLVFLGYPLHPPGRPEKLRDAHLYALSCPMLFLGGTRDNLARTDLLGSVVRKIGPEARLALIENGDHSFKRRKSDSGGNGLDEAVGIFEDWIRRFL